MLDTDFERIRNDFSKADVEGKIDMYVSTEDLSQPQYKELLKLFPLDQLHKLEEALS